MSGPAAGIAALGAALRGGTTSSVALLERARARAAEVPEVDAIASWCPDARAEARARDEDLAAGHDRGPLHGIPVAVKEVVDVAGVPTELGTPGLGHHVPAADAAAVARWRAAGAVVVGTTRTHELAWGMVTPACRNPRDTSRITGGSSGGSAAAVAAGIVPVALGTDTGGSVRNPAALCGVVGVKAAHGAVPMAGVAPLAPTQDCLGVLAGSVADARTALEALGVRGVGSTGARATGRRVGVVTDTWATRIAEPVAAGLAAVLERWRAAGVEVVDVAVTDAELAPSLSYVTMLDESARCWWEAVRPGAVGDEVHHALALGTHVTAEDRALLGRIRARVRAGAARALDGLDAVVLPSCPVTAAPAGAETVTWGGRTVPVAVAHAALTSWASCTGLPAASVPAPVPDGELPVGVQLVSERTDDLLHLAALASDGMSYMV